MPTFLQACLLWFVATSVPAQTVVLDAHATDADLAAYRIATPSATYYLEKSGGGLSSLVDRSGADWLGFDPAPGSGARGEYRGFPNAVHNQPEGHFHPRNEATTPLQTRVLSEQSHRITIEASATGPDGESTWGATYTFTPTHCTFEMTRVPRQKHYWVLYEGTPGGSFDARDWWIASGDATRRPIHESRSGDLPGPEWIAFGDPANEQTLLVTHHEDDSHPDNYFAMQDSMTVFGFARRGGEKFFSAPARFSIGLVDTEDPEEIDRIAREWIREHAPSPPQSGTKQ